MTPQPEKPNTLLHSLRVICGARRHFVHRQIIRNVGQPNERREPLETDYGEWIYPWTPALNWLKTQLGGRR